MAIIIAQLPEKKKQEADRWQHPITIAKPLVLASASPRRKELLEQAGYNLIILPADVDETLPDGISPEDAVKYLANKKAEACAKFILKEKPELTDLPIVAADTVVYKDEIMGKPMDRQDAKRMIQTIRGTFSSCGNRESP